VAEGNRELVLETLRSLWQADLNSDKVSIP